LARLARRRRAAASALAPSALVGLRLGSPHPTPARRACCDIWVFGLGWVRGLIRTISQHTQTWDVICCLTTPPPPGRALMPYCAVLCAAFS